MRREVREELGLEVTATQYVCSYPNTYAHGGMRYTTVDLGFVCEVKDLATAKIAKDEVTQVLFVRPEEIDTTRFGFPSIARIVECYRTRNVTR